MWWVFEQHRYSLCFLSHFLSELSQLDNEQLKAPRERVTFILNSVKILTSILKRYACVGGLVCVCM